MQEKLSAMEKKLEAKDKLISIMSKQLNIDIYKIEGTLPPLLENKREKAGSQTPKECNGVFRTTDSVRICSCRVPTKLKQKIIAHKSGMSAVRYSRTGESLATCGGEQVKVWDSNTGIKLMQFKDLSKSFTCLDCSFDGKFICAGSTDGSIRVFDAVKKKNLFCSRHLNAVNTLAFTQRSSKIISGGNDNCIKIIDCETQKLSLSVHQFLISS